jgi:hypothetical protein
VPVRLCALHRCSVPVFAPRLHEGQGPEPEAVSSWTIERDRALRLLTVQAVVHQATAAWNLHVDDAGAGRMHVEREGDQHGKQNTDDEEAQGYSPS